MIISGFVGTGGGQHFNSLARIFRTPISGNNKVIE